MTPLDRVPDRTPVPAGTGLTLEDTVRQAPGDRPLPAVHATREGFRAALAARVRDVVASGVPEPTVGLVPTMGALHGGHAALVRQARQENDIVVASVFVNPLQFGDPADLENYPRTLEADRRVLGAEGCELVLAPGLEEMYPGYPDAPIVTVSAGAMGQVLEGASRPGHFDGVCTVVAKLWHAAMPPAPARLRSYFGQKDAQQLAVLRRMRADLDFDLEIRPVPLVRSPEGLALSSRNTRLSAEALRAALVLHRALDTLRLAAEAGRPLDVDAAREMVRAEPLATLDYLEVVDHATLEPLGAAELAGPLEREALALVAAEFEPVRLIDNMVLPAASA
ncbi:pantoate--beta-alanine ligase [Citricoccus sp. SGAir0253]|uniref:pantoate--beta-alanine ligase n=1 Tax=Citricoccus sp. SGAir0253 TaxID=2567881 RepID=UPI0010CCC9C3|nr:pantoate--beta-alanine ligase [Citricoccus sp. SGAir0253]QCU76856.1 pantoate--beta-alanine ligase [Citricoccus sp. SGAir0253]